MKDPAFLFYSSDFLTGTMFMTDEQVGMYIRLLSAQHQNGRLTEKHMLSICKTHDEEVFSKFIKDEAGMYYNERLEIESNKRAKFTESRRNNAKGNKKEESNKASAEHMLMHMENENVIKDKPKVYVYNKYYDSELFENGELKQNIPQQYEIFVKFLFGDNEFKKPLAGVLKIRDQISANDFDKLLKTAKAHNKTIRDTVLRIENTTAYHKGKVSFYYTVNNWLKNEKYS